MSSKPILCTENLSKCYRIYDHPWDRLRQNIVVSLKQAFGVSPSSYFREYWALKDVSINIEQGATVGVIGRNGSGKSTLLQVLSGILAPTAGIVEVEGRIAAILELGAGFHPDFTGRENVYLNGALLGLPKQEMDGRFEEIARFADIGEHLEQPVKTYSSGMSVRLAFAIATCVDADILVIDEALAVGDIKFQQQCMRYLEKSQAQGTTIILVSHDLGIVKALCHRAYCLEHGTVVDGGNAGEVVDRYVLRTTRTSSANVRDPVNAMSEPRETAIQVAVATSPSASYRTGIFERSGSGEARVLSCQLRDAFGQQLTIVRFGEAVHLVVTLEAYAPCPRMTVAFYVKDRARLEIIGTNSDYENTSLHNVEAGGTYIYEFHFGMRLRQGCYSITVILANGPDAAEYYDWIEDVLSFEVLPADRPIYALYTPIVEVKVAGPLPQIA